MTVEHRILKKDEPSRANDYGNCYYGCRLCNQARGHKPVAGSAGNLLDPARHPWAEHFEAEGDLLGALRGDGDARYTLEAYDLNDERKVARRQKRRELLEERLELLRELPQKQLRLVELAERLQELDIDRFAQVWEQIADLRSQALRALQDLRSFQAIPPDGPESCRCEEEPPFSLPTAYEKQLIEIELPGEGV